MKHQSKFSAEPQQQSQQAAEQQTQQTASGEFASAEEVLRYDAAQTSVPPEIAERLKKTAADLPAPKRSWWKRWFGGSSS